MSTLTASTSGTTSGATSVKLEPNAPSQMLLVLSQCSNDQLMEEAVSMALVLASFDHHVQIALTDDSLFLCHAQTHKVHKMLSSLELYDMPPLWYVTGISENSIENGITNLLNDSETTLDITLKSTDEFAQLKHQFDTVLIL